MSIMGIVRRVFVDDGNGNSVEIKTQAQLRKLLANLSPEDRELWKDKYRFMPISNNTPFKPYCGTGRDL